MKRLQRLAMLVPFLSLAACMGENTGFTQPANGPWAYVRYVHAMPDTGVVNVRFVDQVENFNGALNIGYRSVTPYSGVTPGSRKIKVFPNTADIAGAQTIIADETVTLNADTYYTILHTGYAGRCNSGTKTSKFVVIQDAKPTVAAGKFALRAIVAAPGFAANQDAYVTPTATTPLPGSPTFVALQYAGNAAFTAPAWVQLDTGAAVVRSFNSGTTTPTNVTSTVMAGAKADVSSVNDLPGSRISGSGLTAFIFAQALGATCAGSGTTQAVYGVDVRPPVPQ
jgi:hypothetical protein